MHERVFDIAAAGVKFGCGEAGETLLVQIDAQRIIATKTHAIQTKTTKKKEINEAHASGCIGRGGKEILSGDAGNDSSV